MAYRPNRFPPHPQRNSGAYPHRMQLPEHNMPRRDIKGPFHLRPAHLEVRHLAGETQRPRFAGGFQGQFRHRSDFQPRFNEQRTNNRLPYTASHNVQPFNVEHSGKFGDNRQTFDDRRLAKSEVTLEGPHHEDVGNVVLDEYNMDLHFNTDSTGLTGWTLHENGFEYLWGGARASYGIKRGKIAYECTIIEALPVEMPPTESNPHVLRVGWSVDNSDLQLGEDKLSYGYGGTGKISTDGKFSDYGRRFSVGDTITCHLDLDAEPKAIFYMVNGEYLGIAFRIGPELSERALFPHVTCKNIKFSLNFGKTWPKYPITPGFTMLQNIPSNYLVRAPSGPANRTEAEIIMMIGLPACGKTVWAEKYCKENPEKKYFMLGTNNIIDKMRIMGLTRKGNYHSRWEALIKQATNCLNVWLKIAERRVHNYILDQTNVYFSARRRKMRCFSGYRRIACVIVNRNEVLHERTARREQFEGKFVPVDAVMEMKANFNLPEVGESFDEVRFVEERPPNAIAIVKAYNQEGMEFKRGTKRKVDENESDQAKISRIDCQIKEIQPTHEKTKYQQPGDCYAEANHHESIHRYREIEQPRQMYRQRDVTEQSYRKTDITQHPYRETFISRQSYLYENNNMQRGDDNQSQGEYSNYQTDYSMQQSQSYSVPRMSIKQESENSEEQRRQYSNTYGNANDSKQHSYEWKNQLNNFPY
eukprot:gene7951-8808_t